MVRAKAYCFDCKGYFELYPDYLGPELPPANCPHCGAVMPEKPFRKLHDIVMQLEEVEKDLRSAADTQGATLFSVDLTNYHPYKGNMRKPN